MFNKLFGSFQNIGEKLKVGWGIGKKIFNIGKSLYNRFFNQPEPEPESENVKRQKKSYSLEQRIIAEKTPNDEKDDLLEKFQKFRSIQKEQNPTGFLLQYPPKPPSVNDNYLDIIPFQ